MSFARFLFLAGSLAAALAARPALAQTPVAPLRGQVTDAATGRPVAYASVGVLHRPVGTVADGQGRFVLAVPAAYDADSLRISLVGYQAYTAAVGQVRHRTCPPETTCAVPLTPNTALAEVVVRPQGRAVRRVLGNSSNSKRAILSFVSKDLGNQLGQGMHIKHPTMLEDVSFHVAMCTYDSVFYRVNVYRLGPDGLPDEQRNMLPEAVYVRLTKTQIADRIRVDLSRYSLWLRPGDNIAVCLELVRDLGPGLLSLSAKVLGGPFLFKDKGYKGHKVGWQKVGAVGAGIDATVTEIRP